jgi:hypothetical protein
MKATTGPYHLGFAKSGARYIYAQSGEQPIKPNVRVNKTTSVEIVANATLFAASWDMYQALMNLIKSAEDGRPIPEWLQYRLIEIEAACDKAEGVS